jgi:hypothetical protein
MRTLLRSADEDPNDALLRLRQLIARGDDELRALGFSMVKELPVPKDRHLLRDLEDTLNKVLPEASNATIRRLGEEARTFAAERTATAAKEWNSRRILLSDEEYQAGNNGEAPGAIRWGDVDETSGLQVGFSLTTLDSNDLVDLSAVPWAFGDTKMLNVWVRQHGNQTTKFTSSEGASEGLYVWFVDKEGRENTRELGYISGALIPKRYRLSQGQWIKLKTCRMRPKEVKPAAEKRLYFGHAVARGEYSLQVQLRIAAFESQNARGEVTVPAQGEWTGTLTAAGGKLHVGTNGD